MRAMVDIFIEKKISMEAIRGQIRFCDNVFLNWPSILAIKLHLSSSRGHGCNWWWSFIVEKIYCYWRPIAQ